MEHSSNTLQSQVHFVQQELARENERYQNAIRNDKTFSEAKAIKGKISLLEKEKKLLKEKLTQRGA